MGLQDEGAYDGVPHTRSPQFPALQDICPWEFRYRRQRNHWSIVVGDAGKEHFARTLLDSGNESFNLDIDHFSSPASIDLADPAFFNFRIMDIVLGAEIFFNLFS